MKKDPPRFRRVFKYFMQSARNMTIYTAISQKDSENIASCNDEIILTLVM